MVLAHLGMAGGLGGGGVGTVGGTGGRGGAGQPWGERGDGPASELGCNAGAERLGRPEGDGDGEGSSSPSIPIHTPPQPLTWYAWSVWTWQRPGGAGGLRGEANARSGLGNAGGTGPCASGPGKAGGTEEVGETGVRLESPSVSESTSTSSSV